MIPTAGGATPPGVIAVVYVYLLLPTRSLSSDFSENKLYISCIIQNVTVCRFFLPWLGIAHATLIKRYPISDGDQI